ncbi:MAG: 1-deoxy-D-xylulose-5-phosphate reductoisomerase [Planctomycetes bacterium]|nr:1-deoxy-D-xylulose-5-phosphate reductoisomerase [Planctomycetota bacterium]
MRKNIVILGSTGSIGRNALKVLARLNHSFKVSGLVAHSNWSLLKEQAKEFRPKKVALIDLTAAERCQSALRKQKIKVLTGWAQAKKIITDPAVDLVLSAVTGAAGLPASLWAIQSGKTLALANKESMVMAGGLLMKLARQKKASIIPVDSEHSAIFQALHCGQSDEVKQIILTASGGPFYNRSARELKKVTPRQALNHPTWRMGPKITIDSATLMNKALEIIEAHWFFGLKASQIKVVIHPQSIIHSMVEFRDGSIMAQMGKPDMKIPIQFALTYPRRLAGANGRLFFHRHLNLSFREPDRKKFPALDLAYEVIRRGGTAGAVLNASNEEAVKLFLQKKISLTDIVLITKKVLNRYRVIKNPSIQQILTADAWARREVIIGKW